MKPALSLETGWSTDADEGADGLFALGSEGGGSGEEKSHDRATRAAGISHVAAQTTPLPLSYNHALLRKLIDALDSEISHLGLDRPPFKINILRDIPHEGHDFPNATVHHRKERQEIQYNPLD